MIHSISSKKRIVSHFFGVKMVRFGLDSSISNQVEILKGENLYDMLYGELGMYPDSIYRISIVFTCSDNSLKWISESVEFNTSYLFSEEFTKFFKEFYNIVKEQREKIKNETGLDSSVVDVIIHLDEDGGDLNVIYEDEDELD